MPLFRLHHTEEQSFHNGHPYNERCDKLAVAAAKADNLLESPIN